MQIARIPKTGIILLNRIRAFLKVIPQQVRDDNANREHFQSGNDFAKSGFARFLKEIPQQVRDDNANRAHSQSGNYIAKQDSRVFMGGSPGINPG